MVRCSNVKALALLAVMLAPHCSAFRGGGFPAAAASVTGYGQAVLADSTGLVSFWPMYEASGTTNTDVVSGYTLTVGANATLNKASIITDGEGRSEEIDTSMEDGNQGNSERADTNQLDIGAAGCIAFWYYKPADCGDLSGAFSRDNGTTSRFLLYFNASASNPICIFSNAGGNACGTGITWGGFHLIVAAWTGSTFEIDVDGANALTIGDFVAPSACDTEVAVGHYWRHGSAEQGCDNERIQGVAFWNVYKNSTQRTALWTASQ